MSRTNRAILVAVFLTALVVFMGIGARGPGLMARYARLFAPKTWRILEMITFLLFSATVALGVSGWTWGRKRSSESHQR